ncbi:hypothetical protein KAFR_0L01660 [Kazachstania africana CBS 2517]|uniref:UBX domain-containing protein n=1 Tax=Kazachstania africana (strain ATCC 22294 / BCRC 22015 / CBS 2517 / CECT 1963 / NBRC 1671 / NRRL Y-8276) TaxID=1071382 RepID=H2B2C6_KAZAF|nr:hypothetical protein KAFR_0L01660 [Kazachstania africana CBS 2517]CCF60776.1 hypothetical protein KAFR_0L01660 [Kazachstania africana CBS 2517]
MSDQSQDIEQFVSLTSTSSGVAKQYIEAFGGLESALNAYYADQMESKDVRHDRETSMEKPRPLSESPLPAASNSSHSNDSMKRSTNNSRFMSFSDMVRHNADEEDDEDKPRNTFAGGETSGLEVTDPTNNSDSLIKDLLEKAKRNAYEENESDSSSNKSSEHQFAGRGYRLGSTLGAPSQLADQPESKSRVQKVKREITFWKEGFQVGDGPLFRYDDPANSFYLNELNQGRAPLNLLNVELGQEVDVSIFKKLDESYRPPKRKLGGFHGEGQRLGSPIPGEPSTPTLREEAPKTKEEVKEAPLKGDTSVQIRYATGKREVLRCFSTDKVQMIYDHIKKNTADIRNFTINHAFPVKAITDMNQTIEEADLANSVVVQRWA